jgi:hypothetical protein
MTRVGDGKREHRDETLTSEGVYLSTMALNASWRTKELIEHCVWRYS